MRKQCNIAELFTRGEITPTEHRSIVLKAIAHSPKVMAPKNILQKICKTVSIDKVTLYRILDLFVAKRILRRMAGQKGTMCYEVICEEHNPQHPHFVCRECGEMECLSGMDIKDLKQRLRRQRYIEDEDIDLKFEGICRNCKVNKSR